MAKKEYQPSKEILEKYADVLVNFALNSGKGVRAGEVVQVVVPDVAKELMGELQNAVLEAGAQPMLRMIPTGMDKDFYSKASKKQLEFFPKKYLKERVNLIDHQIGIIADPDPEELKNVDPEKIMAGLAKKKEYKEWLFDKENKGKFTWTLALWGVEAKAKEVGLSLEKYWEQIIKACFLDLADPIAKWREIFEMQEEVKKWLNSMEIEEVHFAGKDMDITHILGKTRQWVGGSGRNIPSFEIFTSPDWRGTNGWIYFNEPLYRYGNVIKGVRLEFKDGLVVTASAKQGEKLVKQMLKTENANKVGEISLTDKRASRITHVMAETLYDENIGGEFGNTHLAIGSSYHETYTGDVEKQTKKDWERLGYNSSAEHTDIISTTDRVVTARLKNGKEKVIYENGQFGV
ncbi:MAG: aminopeptidase [Candidatus Dojkabacteria bacterium]